MLYLLHFDPPFRHARHYLGFSEGDSAGQVSVRVNRHIAGNGAKLTKHAVESGCELIHVLTMPGGRNEERRIKKSHNVPRLCPLCKAGRPH